MKRKVIQHGPSSLIVSLPNDWVKRNGIKKGDLLDVEETNDKLEISRKTLVKGSSVTADITGLNRTSIVIYIRSLYRKGYDEIVIKFKEPEVPHYRLDKKLDVHKVIDEALSFLIGIEIISQTRNEIVLKQISEDSDKELASMFERVVNLTVYTFKEAEKALLENDDYLLAMVEPHRKSIFKFSSYCMRLINKGAIASLPESLTAYHMLAVYGKIIDFLKELERQKIGRKIKFPKQAAPILRMVVESIELFQKLFRKKDMELVNEIELKRAEFRKGIQDIDVDSDALMLLELFREITELVQDLVECRLRLETL